MSTRQYGMWVRGKHTYAYMKHELEYALRESGIHLDHLDIERIAVSYFPPDNNDPLIDDYTAIKIIWKEEE